MAVDKYNSMLLKQAQTNNVNFIFISLLELSTFIAITASGWQAWAVVQEGR